MREQETFGLDVAAVVRAELPSVAERTVAAIVVEVPSYAEAFRGPMGRRIENAVELALAGFLELATAIDGADASRPIAPAIEGAYALGRGEARTGRSMDALLAAYRVGARVAWRHMSGTAVAAGLSAGALARFAELVFAYIDQLSAASASGHADQLAASGRVRRRHLERLTELLVTGAPPYDLHAAAELADWTPPRTLTAVLLPEAGARDAMALLDARTLQAGEDLPGAEPSTERAVLLVPDAEGFARAALVRALSGRGAVVGPPRPWVDARSSYSRALRALQLGLEPEGEVPVDTELRLADLVLRADGEALADLRAQVLAPLDDLPPGPREKLLETLRSWLLHHGRREQVAAELYVHPQTVRYRMGQLRERFGDRLDDPQTVLALTLALGAR
ncbi:PucR C-terminal helix-turn-helix domain-containing protein [Geodermatophilus dictyosporus]|uniref:PucR C-terminal helix-turn-helix domain-containing protein n=1 Tax=Geodermatophilus dictyosporus TaxID=1523247 RepID=A0A1I5S6H5_9ACTN|nr:PucR family transcriptional regulator [Geodermatophilus dictyosporus]SFP66299.1 PucR C-terminal helix-turn-helix domain-containing protein [Geodermatophilus dictyosporus]